MFFVLEYTFYYFLTSMLEKLLEFLNDTGKNNKFQ